MYEIRCFLCFLHRIGQLQIYTSQGFSPGDTSSVGLRPPPSPRGEGSGFVLASKKLSQSLRQIHVVFLRALCTKSFSLIHRIGQLQIYAPQGFSPDDTSSVCLRPPPFPRGEGSGLVQDRELESLLRARRRGTALAVDEVLELYFIIECDLKRLVATKEEARKLFYSDKAM